MTKRSRKTRRMRTGPGRRDRKPGKRYSATLSRILRQARKPSTH